MYPFNSNEFTDHQIDYDHLIAQADDGTWIAHINDGGRCHVFECGSQEEALETVNDYFRTFVLEPGYQAEKSPDERQLNPGFSDHYHD